MAEKFRLALTAFLLTLVVSPSAASPNLPSNVLILTADDFIGRSYYSVADALEGHTSIDLLKEGYRGGRAVARLRGRSAKNIIVLMDGRPLTFEFDSQVDLSQIPITLVERIEITRGGSSLRYTGEAAGGVINIVTARPAQKGFYARLGTGVGAYGTKQSQGHILMRNYMLDATYLGGLQEYSGFSQNEDKKTNANFLNVSRGIGEKGFWGVEYFFQETRIGVPDGTPATFHQWDGQVERQPNDPSKQRKEELQSTRAIFNWYDLGGGELHSSATFGLRDVLTRVSPGGAALRDQTNKATTLQASWLRENWEIGVDHRRLRRELDSDLGRGAEQTAVYGFKRWTSGRWAVSPGLRYDEYSNLSGFLLPRITATMQPTSRILLNASLQRSFRAPTFDELYLAGATLNNPQLNAEKTWGGDLGARIHPSEATEVKLTGFLMNTKDLIAADPLTLAWENRGEGTRFGLESEASWESGRDQKWSHFTLTGNWTVQRNRVSMRGEQPKLDAPLSPRHLAFGRVEYHLPRKITFVNELRHESAQFELPNRMGARVPPFSVWTMRFQIKMWDADLTAQIENVANRRYSEALILPVDSGAASAALSPQAGRTYWAGITIKFDN